MEKFLREAGWCEDSEYTMRKTQSDSMALTIWVCGFDGYGALSGLMADEHTRASLIFIVWNRAYALFPQHTFLDKEAYFLDAHDYSLDPHQSITDELATLTAAGIRSMPANLDNECGPSHIKSLRRIRRISDKQTWTIDLDISEIKPHSGPGIDVIEHSTFMVSENAECSERNLRHYTLSAWKTFVHAIFRRTFMTVDVDHIPHEWGLERQYFVAVEKLSAEVDDLTRFELTQLPRSERPEGIFEDDQVYPDYDVEIFGCKDVGRAPPHTWTFVDDFLIENLKKLWEDYETQEEA